MKNARALLDARWCLRALDRGSTRTSELIVGVFDEEGFVVSDANLRLDRALTRIALKAVIAECEGLRRAARRLARSEKKPARRGD